jgi:Ran GTPase-activating protein (RanGAP) involved in mRNA processing and transport
MVTGKFALYEVEIWVDLLLHLIRENCVVNLNIHGAEISSSGLGALFETAMESAALVSLLLSGVDFDEMSLAALATLMKRSKSITHYALWDTFEDADITLLWDPLTGNNVVQDLDLSQNGIGVEGARTLGRFLKTKVNKTLTSLNLGFNRFDDEGVLALVDGLKSNESLRKLNLSYCQISDEGAVALASLLMDGSHLVSLNVSNNLIQEAGMKALANALKQNRNLRHLSISGLFGFGKANFESAFIPVFQNNVTLIELDGMKSSKIEALLIHNRELIPAAVRQSALFLIGIRRSTDIEGMGDFAVFPKDIVRLIAQAVWATRRDPIWIQALK